MIPQEYIQEVVARNDITEVIGQYVQLRHRGRTYTGLCPFHNEKTPSFTVYPDTQSFYCFGCGAAGDVINFVRKISNLGYVEAVKQLAGHAGMPMPEEDDQESRSRSRLLEINRNAARYFYDQLNAPTPEAAMPAATGAKNAAFRMRPSAGLAWAMHRKILSAFCTTCATAALPSRNWNPPALSSVAPRAICMISSATA